MNSSEPIGTEQVKNFVEVARKFFEPLRLRRKWPLSLFVWGVTIVIVCWLYVTTGVGELARHNSDEALFIAADALVLGVEPVWEEGPNFTDQSKQNANLLRNYVEYVIDERHLADILKLLNPEYRPKKLLLPLLARLAEAPDDQREAREVLRKAGEEIDEFRKDLEKLSARRVIWFKSERLPKDLIRKVDEALAVSEKLVKKLDEEGGLTLENARAACQANRRTMLLLFLARMGYGSRAKIERFLSVGEKTLELKERLAGTTEDPKVRERLFAWAESEQRRIDMLEGLLGGDMEEVRELLRKTIEKARAEKEKAKLAEGAA